MAYALREMGFQVDLDDKVLIKMADFFKNVRADFLKDGTLDPILDGYRYPVSELSDPRRYAV